MNWLALPALSSDGDVHVVVESPRGSTVKLALDPALRVFALSRPLPAGVVFPYDWGFVPSTQAPDGDPIDAIVIWEHQAYPGVVLKCRLLGALLVEQNSKIRPGRRERNDRLIAVPVKASGNESMTTVDDLPPRLKEELESFFLASTRSEDKALSFLGWTNPVTAYELLRAAIHNEAPDASYDADAGVDGDVTRPER